MFKDKDLNKPNLLIVDDEPQMVQMLEDFVTESFPQFKVYTASDGKRALNFIESVNFEYVFLDYNLPIYKGNQILEQIQFVEKKYRPKMVFVISGEDFKNLEIEVTRIKTKFIAKPVKFEELEEIFNNVINPPKKSVKKKSSLKLDVQFMNPFIDSTLKVLEVTCQTKASKQDVQLKQKLGFSGDISAYYPIESPLFCGYFCLSFPTETYLKIVSKMLMEEYTEVNDENKDGVAELCNQIFGNAKSLFTGNAASGLKMQKPTIFNQENEDGNEKDLGARICIEFTTDMGNFFIETAVQKLK